LDFEGDKVLIALSKAGNKRSENDLLRIMDFLRETKVFSSFNTIVHEKALKIVASKIVLQCDSRGSYIFEEGDRGEHFFIIYEGEIDIVKSVVNTEKMALLGLTEAIHDSITLVKLFRGNSFGEAALESPGVLI
jgi:CRP-like cAMP-binding protein